MSIAKPNIEVIRYENFVAIRVINHDLTKKIRLYKSPDYREPFVLLAENIGEWYVDIPVSRTSTQSPRYKAEYYTDADLSPTSHEGKTFYDVREPYPYTVDVEDDGGTFVGMAHQLATLESIAYDLTNFVMLCTFDSMSAGKLYMYFFLSLYNEYISLVQADGGTVYFPIHGFASLVPIFHSSSFDTTVLFCTFDAMKATKLYTII